MASPAVSPAQPVKVAGGGSHPHLGAGWGAAEEGAGRTHMAHRLL